MDGVPIDAREARPATDRPRGVDQRLDLAELAFGLVGERRREVSRRERPLQRRPEPTWIGTGGLHLLDSAAGSSSMADQRDSEPIEEDRGRAPEHDDRGGVATGEEGEWLVEWAITVGTDTKTARMPFRLVA